MAIVTWTKCTGDNWCPLETVDLTNVSATGIYIIWHGGPTPWTVRVGQGDIAGRIATHRLDPKILFYKAYGLLVTWAVPAHADLDGMERYLGDRLKPRVGSAFPQAVPIPVNTPW